MVELKKELPEIFEEFAEQRKNSFLAIKEVKEKEIPVVGVFCTYLPREIPNAMGAAVVGLCSVSDETIPDAEKDLPRNLCPLIKSSYGFAKTDKCPFFYFSDLVVGETTCDGKKKMYEMLADFKPVHVVELPNCQTEDGIQLYKKELLRFKKVLEDKFETTITDEAVLHQIKLRNGINKALRRLQYVMANDPAPVNGLDVINTVYGSGFDINTEGLEDRINAVTDKIEKEYTGTEFFRLSDPERIRMGLRRLQERENSHRSPAYHTKQRAIKIDHVSLRYGEKRILNNLSFTAFKGDIIGIVGKNGVGKSTFCRSVCGLHTLSTGSIQIEGGYTSEKERRSRQSGNTGVLRRVCRCEAYWTDARLPFQPSCSRRRWQRSTA